MPGLLTQTDMRRLPHGNAVDEQEAAVRGRVKSGVAHVGPSLRDRQPVAEQRAYGCVTGLPQAA